MRIYLADFFGNKEVVASRAKELQSLGYEVTARWYNEAVPHTVTIKDVPVEYHRETAVADVEDVLRADVFILQTARDQDLTEIPARSLARGGRHFESGLFYGAMLAESQRPIYVKRRMLLLGHRENIFHHLDGIGVAGEHPQIDLATSWGEALAYLKELEKQRNVAA